MGALAIPSGQFATHNGDCGAPSHHRADAPTRLIEGDLAHANVGAMFAAKGDYCHGRYAESFCNSRHATARGGEQGERQQGLAPFGRDIEAGTVKCCGRRPPVRRKWMK